MGASCTEMIAFILSEFCEKVNLSIAFFPGMLYNTAIMGEKGK